VTVNETARVALLRRGFTLEYTTLAWNVVGIVALAIAAISARSVALAGFGLDSLIEIGASTVVVWELSGTGEDRQRRALKLRRTAKPTRWPSDVREVAAGRAGARLCRCGWRRWWSWAAMQYWTRNSPAAAPGKSPWSAACPGPAAQANSSWPIASFSGCRCGGGCPPTVSCR
jgi:hypothetical protein